MPTIPTKGVEVMDFYNVTIGSEVFEKLRSEFDTMVNAVLIETNKTGKEAEISIKINIKVEKEQRFEKGKLCKEWNSPRFTWKIERKSKPDKYGLNGNTGHGFALRFDEDGKQYLEEAEKQVEMRMS